MILQVWSLALSPISRATIHVADVPVVLARGSGESLRSFIVTYFRLIVTLVMEVITQAICPWVFPVGKVLLRVMLLCRPYGRTCVGGMCGMRGFFQTRVVSYQYCSSWCVYREVVILSRWLLPKMPLRSFARCCCCLVAKVYAFIRMCVDNITLQ